MSNALCERRPCVFPQASAVGGRDGKVSGYASCGERCMRFLGHLLPRSYSWTFDYVLVGAWCGLYALYDPVDTDVLFTGSGGRGGFICCGGCGDGDECGIEVVNAVSSRVSAVDSAMPSGTVFFRREVVGFSDYSASVLSRAGSGLFSDVDAGFFEGVQKS